MSPGQLIESLESRRLFALIYVDANAPGPTHDGSSWTNAYTTMNFIAQSGDVVAIAHGTYNAFLPIYSGVQMYGGYAGNGASNPDARDPNAYPTIFADTTHLVINQSATASTLLDGVTIQNGFANGPRNTGESTDPEFPNFYGGGLVVGMGGSPTINNCIFLNNRAGASGGAVLSYYASPTFTNCSFINNSATTGGAILVMGGTATVKNSLFRGNSGYGAAINTLYSATISAAGCLFIDNPSDGSVAVSGNYVNCTFTANNGTNTSGLISGGTLTNCIVWGNSGTALKSSSATFSDIQGGTSGTGNINSDPLFIRNPNIASSDFGNLELQAASPCINTGNTAALPAGIALDIDGNPRIRDAVVDMGAYEYAPPDTTPPTASLAQLAAAAHGNSSESFQVSYQDNKSIDLSSLGSSNIFIQGPGGFNQFAQLDTAATLAVYHFTPPGGFWDASDNGDYTITLQPNQVKDTSGNFAASVLLGTLHVSIGSDSNGNGNGNSGGPTTLAASISATIPSSIVAGSKGSAKIKIANTGNSKTSAPFSIQLLISPDGSADSSDPVIETIPFSGSLAPGKSKTLSYTFTYPQSLTGNFFLIPNIVSTNNSVSTSVASSLPTVNLAAPTVNLSASITARSPLHANKKNTAKLTITNVGNTTFNQQVPISLLNSSDNSSLLSTNLKINLKPGAHKTFTLTFTPTAGTYSLIASLDPNHQTGDVDYSNNTSQFGPITVS